MTLLDELPLSQIKIDKSFVQGGNNSEKSKAIVKATLDLGPSINLDVSAEGVENQQPVSQLTAMGCKLIQGYHVAQPLAVADLDL
jgi:EAL domain-containing protein (putative c-di-GMP-specific phosphodiesterase class I)